MYRIFITSCLGMIITLAGCKKEESSSTPTTFTLTGLTAGTSNLLTGNAVNVPIDFNITAVFSANVDYTTVNQYSVTLKHDTSHIPITYVVTANTLSIVPTATAGLLSGAYLTLSLNPHLRSTGGLSLAETDISFTTIGIGIDTPPAETLPYQVLYLQFNGNIVDLTGNAAPTYAQLSYTTDRYGVANDAGYFQGALAGGTGDIVELAGGNLIPPSMTLSVWINIIDVDYGLGGRGILGMSASNGYYFEIGGDTTISTEPGVITFASSNRVYPDPRRFGFGGRIAQDTVLQKYRATSTARTSINSYNANSVTNDTAVTTSSKGVFTLLIDGWHQFVMTYDSGSSTKTFYVDGKMIEYWILGGTNHGLKGMALNLSDTTGLDPKLAIGYYCSRINTLPSTYNYSTALNTFIGAIDDMRIFRMALTSSQVTALYLAEQPPQ